MSRELQLCIEYVKAEYGAEAWNEALTAPCKRGEHEWVNTNVCKESGCCVYHVPSFKCQYCGISLKDACKHEWRIADGGYSRRCGKCNSDEQIKPYKPYSETPVVDNAAIVPVFSFGQKPTANDLRGNSPF